MLLLGENEDRFWIQGSRFAPEGAIWVSFSSNAESLPCKTAPVGESAI